MNAARLGRSRAALLQLVSPQLESASSTAKDGSEDLDWDWILERATAHKVAPLLAARVEQGGLAERLAPAQRERLAAIRAGARQHVDIARRSLSFLDRHFGEAGIPYLVVKGSVLAELVYPAPDMRIFSDVDVVVSPERVEAAAAVLQSLGCRLGQIRQTLGSLPRHADELEAARRLTRHFYERFEYELPYLAPTGSGLLPVDLHWHIAPRFRLSVGIAQVWERTRRVSLGGVEVTTLDWEATAIHLAIHATTCAYAGFRLLHLCDVAWVAARTGDGVWELAARWQAHTHLRTVLEMTGRLFPARATHGTPSTGRPSIRLPVGFALATDQAFLIDGTPKPLLRQLWRELLWGVAMSCLRRNVIRALGVRLTRARWRWTRWRAGRPEAL